MTEILSTIIGMIIGLSIAVPLVKYGCIPLADYLHFNRHWNLWVAAITGFGLVAGCALLGLTLIITLLASL